MRKRHDWWFWMIIAIFATVAIICIATAGCGKLLEGTGNILEAGGQGLTFVGEHLVDTGKESSPGQ